MYTLSAGLSIEQVYHSRVTVFIGSPKIALVREAKIFLGFDELRRKIRGKYSTYKNSSAND